MCGHTCTRSFLILLSILFLFIGGALLGGGIYGSVYGLVHGQDFLDQFFEKAAVEDELTRHIKVYFMVMCYVSIGLGSLMFLTGIGGSLGACQNFRGRSRYGDQRSTFGGFVFCVVLIILASAICGAFILYINFADGDGGTNGTGSGLSDIASQVYDDLVEFCLRTRFNGVQSKGDSIALVTNTVFLTGGVMSAVVVLLVIWLIVGCCFKCGPTYRRGDVDMYVSPENQRYDDWVHDGGKSAYS